MGKYTDTGSGTSSYPAMNYSKGTLGGGVTDYTNGQIKATVYSHSSGTITFRVAKTSGYYKNGNSGKIFILDNYNLNVYVTSFSISNSSTSYVPAYVKNYEDFTGTRTFWVFLITSDQIYKQFGGEISITGSQSQLPPTVQTDEPSDITSSSAKFKGRVNPNGSKTKYYFKYGNSSSMNQKTKEQTLSASSGETDVSVTVTGLSSGSNYSVQLWAENDGGTSKGSVQTFDTEEAANNPPERPHDPKPENTSTDAPLSGTLSWSCSDPEGDDITYDVYLGTSSSDISYYDTTSSTSCSYSSLEPATIYYWYVEASDGNQTSTSQTWNFKTKSNLSKPTDPTPEDNAKDVPTSGTFSWKGNNDGDVTYSVWIGTSSLDLKVYDTTKETSLAYSGLDPDEYYYWKVIVTDGKVTESSALWKFVTKGSDIVADCEFPDVPKTNDFYEPTCYLYKLNVLSGSDVSGKMDVEGNLTRAHLAKIAFRGVYSIKGRSVPVSVPSDNYPTVYSDLTDNSTYYYQAARALLYLEYGDGVSPFDRDRLEFAPDDNITRLHTLKVLMETFNIRPANNDYVSKAAELGIITTNENTFRPNDKCLRGEAFAMLSRIMQKVDNGEIGDPNPDEADYFEPLNVTLKTIALGLSLPMGNFQHYTKTSFAMNGVVPLVFAHTYNSYNTTLPEAFYGAKNVNGIIETYQPLGDGWSHNFHTFITVVGSGSSLKVVVHWGGGKIDVYKSNGSELVPESYGVYDKLYSDGSDYIVKSKRQIEYRFSKQGGSGATVLYLSSIKDRNGNTITVNYESGVNGSMRISSVSDGSRELSFSYRSGTDLISKISDPLRRSVTFDYTLNENTGRYQLSTFTDAKGQTTNYFYGSASKLSSSRLLTRIRLPKGNYIENEYDANRRLTKTESGINGVPKTRTSVDIYASYGSSTSTQSQVIVDRGSGSTTYNYIYNANNVVTKMTGENGLSISSDYGDSSHPELPTSMRSNATDASSIEYDDMGNVLRLTTKSTGGSGSLSIAMTFDSMNNITSVTDARGNKTTYSYDSNGNLIGTSAPEGVSSSLVVDSKGLLTSKTDAMGVTTSFEYNSFGNLTKTTLQELGISNSAEYDKASRLVNYTDALGRSSSFSYDDNDNIISDTDPENHTTHFEYDENDNLTEITNAKGGVTSLSYDNATDWLTSVSFAGATKQYKYNEDGTIGRFTKPDGTTLNYTYDDLGCVTNDGVNSYSYDSQLRLSSVSGNGKTLSYTYDGFNRIIATDLDGHRNNYTYDNNSNCTSINNTTYDYDKLNRMSSVTFSGKTITYTYRKDNQISEVGYPNGMTTTFSYDAGGRLTGKKTALNDGTIIASYSFNLDKEGNITKQTVKEPYSGISLTNEDISYSYNSGNRITKAGDVSFSFDENGNTTKRGGEQYQWDEKDRLMRAGSTSIEYDPLGLISSFGNIKFTTDPLGMGNVLSDSKSGAEYIYGNGLEARVINGQVSYYVTDIRGSVVAIVDDNGNITHKYQYDDYGKVTQKEETDYNPFQYVGKYGVMYLTDHQYYMRARHYDPTIGRFFSEDPVWDTNLYAYAGNNPIMYYDPSGNLFSETVRPNVNTPSGGGSGGGNNPIGNVVDKTKRRVCDVLSAFGADQVCKPKPPQKPTDEEYERNRREQDAEREALMAKLMAIGATAIAFGSNVKDFAQYFANNVKQGITSAYKSVEYVTKSTLSWAVEHKWEIVTVAAVAGGIIIIVATDGAAAPVLGPGMTTLATEAGAGGLSYAWIFVAA